MPHTSVSTSGFKAPSTREIPPVALTNIPHIEAKVFQPYLSQVGSLYEAFQRAKQEGDGEHSLFRREKKPKEEDWDSILSTRLQRPGHSRSGSLSSPIATPLQTPQPKRKSSGQRRQQAVTPLSTVPSVYLEDDFHLENPRTFDVVSERAEIVKDPNQKPGDAPSGRRSLASNAILQEKLSWYLDTVEIHLISSISTASKSFFSALGSLRELHAEAADSVERIQHLRKDLAKLDKEMAMGGLKVVNLKQRRDNVRQLGEAILQLKDVVASIHECEEKVERGEIDGALDSLDSVEDLMAGLDTRSAEKGQQGQALFALRDLRRIKALQGATDDLNHLRFRIGKGYEARFLASLLGDVRRHVEKVPPNDTYQRWNSAFTRLKPGQRRQPSAFPAYMSMDPSLRSELEAELTALSRARHTMPAASAFKSAVLKEMKTLIRKHLPSSSDDDNESVMSASTMGSRGKTSQEKSSMLARNLRAMDAEDAQIMLGRMYVGISEGLRRLSVQVKILLDITSAMGGSSSDPRSPPESAFHSSTNGSSRPLARRRATSTVQEELQQVLDLSSLLGEAVDAAQGQITRIVKVRSEQTSHLPLSDFLRFFNLNRLFADECEAISGRSSLALKTVVDKQIRDFVSQFVDAERNNLLQVMDADKWDAKDFGEADILLLKSVLDSSTTDAAAWRSETANESETNGAAPNGSAPTPGAKDRVRSAVIDEQKFILPMSAIVMLRSTEHFSHLTAGIPSMSQEIASGLLDTLKVFNSRSSQLILGAGATRSSAGLKNITTKHLAISAQALSFVIALTPYIREFFRRYVPQSSANQTMAEFDKVKRLLQEHQHGIHEKLVEIMSSRCAVHIAAMKKVDWEQKSEAPHAYMENLMKETATLHKVLTRLMPEEVIASIMRPVFASYREEWSRAFGEVKLSSMAAKER